MLEKSSEELLLLLFFLWTLESHVNFNIYCIYLHIYISVYSSPLPARPIVYILNRW